MPTMTLAIPQDLKDKMDGFPEMNWSEVARQSFKKRIELLTILNDFAKDSTLTEEDALRMGAEVSRRLAKRYKIDEISRRR
jgi:hypothetical protein